MGAQKNRLIQTVLLSIHNSVRVYPVIISKYATKIDDSQNRQVAFIHGTQNHTFRLSTNLTQLNIKDS